MRTEIERITSIRANTTSAQHDFSNYSLIQSNMAIISSGSGKKEKYGEPTKNELQIENEKPCHKVKT